MRHFFRAQITASEAPTLAIGDHLQPSYLNLMRPDHSGPAVMTLEHYDCRLESAFQHLSLSVSFSVLLWKQSFFLEVYPLLVVLSSLFSFTYLVLPYLNPCDSVLWDVSYW